MAEDKTRQYQVKLKTGFNASRRRRSGIEVAKGTTETLDLTDAQVKELQSDGWFELKEVSKSGSKAAAQTGSPQETEAAEKARKAAEARKELIAEAQELDIEFPRNIKSDDLQKKIDDKKSEEQIDITEKSLDELKELAAEMKVEVEPHLVDGDDETSRANLMVAIEAANTDNA